MTQLRSCHSCMSLNPTTQTLCLHCDAKLPKTSSPLRAHVLKGASALAISMTLSACYGGGERYRTHCLDRDRDGHCAEVDCDDRNPSKARDCGKPDVAPADAAPMG